MTQGMNLVTLTTAFSEDVIKWGMFLTELAESCSSPLLAQLVEEQDTVSLYHSVPVPPAQLAWAFLPLHSRKLLTPYKSPLGRGHQPGKYPGWNFHRNTSLC